MVGAGGYWESALEDCFQHSRCWLPLGQVKLQCHEEIEAALREVAE
jgi:hypothetical protein